MLLQTLFAVFLLSGPASIDVRVDGEGYLRFASEYKVSYAKSAKLVVADGKLVHFSGARVMPTISVPTDTISIEVDLQGNIVATSKRGKSACGRLVLALFASGTALSPNGLFLSSPERPGIGNPGEGTNGVIRSSGDTGQPTAKLLPKLPKATPAKPIEKATDKVADAAKTSPKNNPPKTTVPPKRVTGEDSKIEAAPKASTPAVTIVISAKSLVSGTKILLGDIAKIEGDEATKLRLSTVFLGETPTFNVKRVLTRQSIATRLLAAKEKPENFTIIVPEGAEIWRQGQVVTGEDLTSAALAYAKQQLGLTGELTVKESVNETQVPAGKLEIVPIAISDSIPNVVVTVSLRVDGRNVSSKTVRLMANVAEGVKAGEAVKILIRSNGAVVEVGGKARFSAVVGQTVTVISSRNTQHTGKVIAPGVVEVKL